MDAAGATAATRPRSTTRPVRPWPGVRGSGYSTGDIVGSFPGDHTRVRCRAGHRRSLDTPRRGVSDMCPGRVSRTCIRAMPSALLPTWARRMGGMPGPRVPAERDGVSASPATPSSRLSGAGVGGTPRTVVRCTGTAPPGSALRAAVHPAGGRPREPGHEEFSRRLSARRLASVSQTGQQLASDNRTAHDPDPNNATGPWKPVSPTRPSATHHEHHRNEDH